MQIASLVVAMSADLTALRRGFTTAVSETRRMTAGIQTAFAAVGLTLGVRQVTDLADSWKLAEGRLSFYTTSAENLTQVQGELFAIAQQTRSEFAEVANLYSRLSLGAKEFGLSQRQILAVTRTMTQALAIFGASSGEAAGAIRQFSQALASGKLQGQELNTLLEQATPIAQAIAEHLGVGLGQLKKLAETGKITTGVIVASIAESSDKIAAQFAKVPLTVGGAFVQLGNSIQKFVGETDKALGASRRLVGVINAVGNAFDKNRPLVEALALTLGATGLTLVIFKLIAAARGLAIFGTIAQLVAGWRIVFLGLGNVLGMVTVSATLMWKAIAGPVGIALALGAVFAVFLKFRRDAEASRDEVAKLSEELGKLSKVELGVRANQIISQLEEVRRKKLELDAAFKKELGAAGNFGFATQATQDALAQAKADIDSLNRELGLVLDLRHKINGETAKGAGGKTTDTFDFEKFAKEGGRLLDLFDDLRDRKESTSGLASDLVKLFDTATQKLAGLKNPLSDEAKFIQDLLKKIRDNAEAMAVIHLEKARIEFPIIPEIIVPPLDQVESKLAKDLADAAARVGVLFGQEVGIEVGNALRLMTAPTIEIIPEFKPPTENDFRNLQAQIERLTTQKGLVDLAAFTGDKAFESETIKEFDRVYNQVISTVTNLAEAIRKSNLPIAEQVELLRKLGLIAAAAPGSLNKTSNSLQKFAVAGRGLNQIAQQFTNINKSVLQVIGSLIDAAEAIDQFNKAKAEKDVLGQITGALGAAGAAVQFGAAVGDLIFGAIRRAEKEREGILKTNNEELAKLRLELRGLNNLDIGQQVDLGKRLVALTFGPGSKFKTQVEALGFSMGELAVLAHEAGITIFDSAGNIIPEALHIWGEALLAAAEKAARFGDSFDEALEARRLLNRARGLEEDPARIIADNLAVFKQFAPELFERFFSAVDFANPAAIRAAIDKFITDWLAGVIPTDLFKGLDPVEIRSVLTAWLDAADAMRKGMDEITGAMINVPEIFKIERIRARAILPTPPLDISGGVARGGLTPPTPPVVPATVTNDFDVVINIDGSKSPEETADAVAKVFRRESRTLGPLAFASDAMNRLH